MLVTSLCWWLYDGDGFEMLVAESVCWRLLSLCWWFFQCIKSVTNILNRSSTSETPVININVTHMRVIFNFDSFKKSQKEPFHKVVDDSTGKAEAFINVTVLLMWVYLPNGYQTWGDGPGFEITKNSSRFVHDKKITHEIVHDFFDLKWILTYFFNTKWQFLWMKATKKG